jgi:MFS family permease
VSGSTSYGTWIVAAVLLGLGTAMVYPTLLAAVGDVAHPMWRARAVGVYRLWRDGGFAAGALLAGLIADLWGPDPLYLGRGRPHRRLRSARRRSHV